MRVRFRVMRVRMKVYMTHVVLPVRVMRVRVAGVRVKVRV